MMNIFLGERKILLLFIFVRWGAIRMMDIMIIDQHSADVYLNFKSNPFILIPAA